VGYGDYYPVTPESRFVATILMGAGVNLFGTFSGLLAAWSLAPEEGPTDSEFAALRSEIASLKQALEVLRKD
jgi:voltage-gated potassium channel